MQTSEIALNLDDCKAQLLDCIAKTVVSGEFDQTFTETLGKLDRQNLPVDEKGAADPSSESSAPDNGFVLSWLAAILSPSPLAQAAPAVAEVTSPTRDFPPPAVTEKETNTVTETTDPVRQMVPKAAAPDPSIPIRFDMAAAAFPASPPKTLDSQPKADPPLNGDVAMTPAASETIDASLKDAPVVGAAYDRAPLPTPESVRGHRPRPQLAETKVKEKSETADTSSPPPTTQPEQAAVESAPIMVAMEIPVQPVPSLEGKAPAPVSTLPISEAQAAQPAIPAETPKASSHPRPLRNLQVSEPVQKPENIEPDVELPSTPGPAPKEAKGKAIHEPSTASHAAARQVDEPHQQKVSGAIPLESPHHVSSNDETPTPIVSAQSGHESRNLSDGPQDNREKPATDPDAFPKAIHRALTSPSPAMAEDGKPIVAATPLSVEPAVVHRSVMNATGDHGAAAILEMPAEPQKASVISQLVEKAQLLVRDRNSEIVIALKPDSLGRITLRASMVDNELVTTIVAESHAVKTILQADLPALHSVLQEAGVETARVIVAKETDMNFAGGAPSNHSFEFQQPQHQSQQQAGSSRWYDEWASMNLEGEQPQLSRVPVSVDSRYAARSIHFIA